MQTRSIMTALLAAQLMIAGALFIHGRTSSGGQAPEPLLAFPSGNVDRIVISDNAGSATLQRDDNEWRLGELAGLPANESRIETLLGNLSTLKTQWPVASTSAGRERFEVSEQKFQRHLSLYQGDSLLGEYYFGTSPGFRQTHARRANDDEVYALAFNNFDLPADDNDWLQKDLLAVADVTAIKGDDFELTLQDEEWQLAPPPAVGEMELDVEKARSMATTLRNLDVLRVADKVPAGESHTLSVSTKDGSRQYLFTKVDSQYFVKRDDLEQVFTISAGDYDKLASVTRSTLLKSLPDAPAVDAQPAPKDAAPPEPAVVPPRGT